jgi:hypothetical protein
LKPRARLPSDGVLLDDYVASAFKRRQMGAEIAVGGAEYGTKPRELDLVSMWQRIEGGNNAQPQRLVDAFVGRALFYG